MRRLVLVGAAALALAVAAPAPAVAACGDVVFTGVALPGPAGAGGALLSPATFAVLDRERGRVDSSALVETAIGGEEERLRGTSAAGITATPGEVWRIVGGAPGDDGVVDTGGCAGSRLLRQASQGELAAAAAAAAPQAPGEPEAGGESAPAIVLVTGSLLLAALVAGAVVAARRRSRG